MQNSVISIWNTSLYGSQPLSVVFACKTATFWAELQVSIDPRPHLSFCACKTANLGPGLQVCMGPRPHLRFWVLITACLAQEQKGYIGSRPHLSFCACTTACLASELLVSMGPSPHLWFLHAKRQVLYPNNECLWVPDLTCHFVYEKQRD